LARPAGTTTLRTETEWFKRPEPAPEVKSSEEEIITRIESLSKKKNASMAQIALSWMLHKPGMSPIFYFPLARVVLCFVFWDGSDGRGFRTDCRIEFG
jgi:hypothetical protein